MRNIICLLVIVMGCSQRDSQNDFSNQKDSLANITPRDTIVIPAFEHGRPGEMVFAFIDSIGNYSQTLSVFLLTGDSIEFHLKTETGPCDTEYWGKAVSDHSSEDSEIDEDEDGAYAVTEYVVTRDEYQLQIRIAEDRDKARIFYTSEGETDCLPVPDLLLKRQNQ